MVLAALLAGTADDARRVPVAVKGAIMQVDGDVPASSTQRTGASNWHQIGVSGHAAARHPGTMKMGPRSSMLAGVSPDKVGSEVGASSLRVSVTGTAPRTRNCRLPPWESTQSRLLRCSLSSGRDHRETAHGHPLLRLCRLGRS
jgi:hypothetical protein